MTPLFDSLDIDKIHRAFSPAREIQDPRLFVGRKDEIQAGITALLNPGGFIAIFGLRGVGRSSLAYQIKLIAEGRNDVPQALGLHRFMPKKKFNYIVRYLRCDGFVYDIPALLKRILFGDETNPSLFSLTKAGEKKLKEMRKTLELEGKAGFFGTNMGIKGGEQATYENYISDDLIQQFRQLLGTINKDNQNKRGLLILIDEFDTIPNKQGFASIIKACSSDYVKFGVIGIASSVTELIREHSSIGRQIDSIYVPTMSPTELSHILRTAEHWVGNRILFDMEASNTIVQRSEGFPYFTHLLGKEAMLLAYKRGGTHVTEDDIQHLGNMIVEGKLQTVYEDFYQAAVKNSPQREILLKAFAEQEADEINTEEIYALVKELGISNPSQLMKELTATENYTPVLVKVRERCYRFSDPVFKVYASLRQWKF